MARHKPLRLPKKSWGVDKMFTTPLNLSALVSVEPIAWTYGFDGVDTNYEFSVYPIHAKPRRAHAIYLFCCSKEGRYEPVYIGEAEDLHSRLVGHERLVEAGRLGATDLLVHSSDFDYIEAERRFIARYNPILNVQHRTQLRWPPEPLSSRLVSPLQLS